MIEVYKNGDINDKLTGGKVESFLTESKIDVKMRDDLQETLFITRLTYTTGDIKTRIHSMGEDEAFQA